MASADEKRLFRSFNNTIDHFWSKFFFPHVSNSHTCINLNKQVATHFFYQAIVGCRETLDYILTSRVESSESTTTTTTTSSSSSLAGNNERVVFTNRIAKELPMVTVVVDHEDADLISYNKQCLHAYYATLRILCERSEAYTREMCTHSNFGWAFKHIFPFYALYPQAAQELNQCMIKFVNAEPPPIPQHIKEKRKQDRQRCGNETGWDQSEEDDDDDDSDSEFDSDEETHQWRATVQSFKENMMTTILTSNNLDIKQCWQSILLCTRAVITSMDDATLALTRRALPVLSVCLFHVSFLHHHHQANAGLEAGVSTSSSSSTSSASSLSNAVPTSAAAAAAVAFSTTAPNLSHDLCECMLILASLCEAAKHHMDKKIDGTNLFSTTIFTSILSSKKIEAMGLCLASALAS
jgi:hypothetical protein